ncbi:MAG: TetR/AcrR family transcriptional regulator [Hyphomicrobium sp.]|nr:TetR/AcrR family transcriptional regulator [Hyphomicrobium sp.]
MLQEEPEKSKRGRRGIKPADLVDAALEMLAADGEHQFSVRKLAAAVGVDGMTILHHFKSREGLLRAVADAMVATLDIERPSGTWREKLMEVARRYRGLANKYPRAFSIVTRFQTSGPADFELGEIVYSALIEAGMGEEDAADYGMGLFSLAIGFGVVEVGGMLDAAPDEELREIDALDPRLFPVTRRLAPVLARDERERVFEILLGSYLDGVARALSAKGA